MQLPIPNGIILGDSGYALSNWLITPISAPANQSEIEFNRHHKRMRRLIECCNGVLKERFRCLKNLHCSPKFAGEIVKACCVLHNLMIDVRSEQFDVTDIELSDDLSFFPIDEANDGRRNELLTHFLSFD